MPNSTEVITEKTFEDFFRFFRLYKGFILLTTLLFFGLGLFIVRGQPDIYQATTRVLLETERDRPVEFREVRRSPYGSQADMKFLMTELKIMTSPEVMKRVIEDLSLAAFPPFSRFRKPHALLRSMLTVELVRTTNLFDLSVTGTNPVLVTRLVNAIADTYALMNLERLRSMTVGGIQWLREEVAKAEQKMKSAQLVLQQFREQHKHLPLGREEQATFLQRLEQLNSAVTGIKKRIIETETKYREKHPTVLELQMEEQELEQALAKQEELLRELNRLLIEYTNLQRDAQTSEVIYNTLLTRLKELSVAEGLQTNNVRVMTYAEIPDGPIGPNRTRGVILFSLIGLAVGLGMVLAREALNKTIRTRKEFEQLIGMPCLGLVPLIRRHRFFRRAEGPGFLLYSDPLFSNLMRSIRTTLEFILADGKPKTLLVTSAVPSEGKTVISLNLAVSLQEMGRKVLLLEGDMRRPNLYQTLQVESHPGLSEYLQEQANLGQVAQISLVAQGLAVVTGGSPPAEPVNLLNTPRFRELLEMWKGEYQYIIIDSPPILVAADSAVLSTVADGVIFLVRAEQTPHEAVLLGKRFLMDVGCKIVGGILNGAHLEFQEGYGYYYYYRGGKYYHRRHLEGEPKTPPSEPPSTAAGGS